MHPIQTELVRRDIDGGGKGWRGGEERDKIDVKM